MRVLLIGHGRMGKMVESLAPEYGATVAAIATRDNVEAVLNSRDLTADVAVDFTLADAVSRNLPLLAERRLNVVIGTTGWAANESALREIAERAGIGVLVAPNFSLGMNIFQLAVEDASRNFAKHAEFGAWIHESHHAMKKDAPSGTARATAEGMGGDPSIHSVRLPGLIAHQEVLLAGEGQLLTIRHDTLARESFVPGVLLALEKLPGLPPGLTVGLDALL